MSSGAGALFSGCDGLLRPRLPQRWLVDGVGGLVCLMSVPVSSHPSSASDFKCLHLGFVESGSGLELWSSEEGREVPLFGPRAFARAPLETFNLSFLPRESRLSSSWADWLPESPSLSDL
jgi:hypothetical protein